MKKTCIICGREFYTQISNKVACSPVCAKKRKRQTERERREKQVKFGKVIEAKVCPECGKTFTPDVPQRVYCSNYCAERHRRAAHNLSTRKLGPVQESKAKKKGPSLMDLYSEAKKRGETNRTYGYWVADYYAAQQKADTQKNSA